MHGQEDLYRTPRRKAGQRSGLNPGHSPERRLEDASSQPCASDIGFVVLHENGFTLGQTSICDIPTMALLGVVIPILAFAFQQGITPVESPCLQVLRASPIGDASPRPTIVVTFDRPVAPHLDASIDPRKVLSASPAFVGRAQWLDPVTLILRPLEILPAGQRYSVTVSTNVVAADGSRLRSAYTFAFHTPGPRALAARPDFPASPGGPLPLSPRFQVIYSREVDTARLNATARILILGQLMTTCRDSTVPVTVLDERPVTADDSLHGYSFLRPWSSFGRPPGRSLPDTMRRLVTISSRIALPVGCKHRLMLPREVIAGEVLGYESIDFATHGSLTLNDATFDCQLYTPCSDAILIVKFSTPLDGSAVRHHVHIDDIEALPLQDSTVRSAVWYYRLQGAKPRSYAVLVDTALRDIYGQSAVPPFKRTFEAKGDPLVWLAPFGPIITVERKVGVLPIWTRGVDTVTVSTTRIADNSISIN